MASANKIIDKMKRQPNGIRIDEVDKVLKHNGYTFDRQKGSHRLYINADGKTLSIPERKPTVKSCYVNEIISRLGL